MSNSSGVLSYDLIEINPSVCGRLSASVRPTPAREDQNAYGPAGKEGTGERSEERRKIPRKEGEERNLHTSHPGSRLSRKIWHTLPVQPFFGSHVPS